MFIRPNILNNNDNHREGLPTKKSKQMPQEPELAAPIPPSSVEVDLGSPSSSLNASVQEEVITADIPQVLAQTNTGCNQLLETNQRLREAALSLKWATSESFPYLAYKELDLQVLRLSCYIPDQLTTTRAWVEAQFRESGLQAAVSGVESALEKTIQHYNKLINYLYHYTMNTALEELSKFLGEPSKFLVVLKKVQWPPRQLSDWTKRKAESENATFAEKSVFDIFSKAGEIIETAETQLPFMLRSVMTAHLALMDLQRFYSVAALESVDSNAMSGIKELAQRCRERLHEISRTMELIATALRECVLCYQKLSAWMDGVSLLVRNVAAPASSSALSPAMPSIQQVGNHVVSFFQRTATEGASVMGRAAAPSRALSSQVRADDLNTQKAGPS
jgi:hypothetical protein